MFKTFIAGILLGVAGAAAGLYYIPVVDQAREQSMIVVHPNLGSTETFHINIPNDRILVGVPGLAEPLPSGLEWPNDLQFAATRAEVFKIRNGKEAVALANKAIELAGQCPPDWLEILAAAQAEAGSFDEAIRWQTQAIEAANDKKKPDASPGTGF